MGFVDEIRSRVAGFLPTTAVSLEQSGEVVEKGWDDLRSTVSAVVSNANPDTISPTITPTLAINKYRSWVYACVNLIAGKVSTVPYYLYQEVGNPHDEEYNRILQHPVISLLKRPNKFQSGRLFRQIIQMHLELCGMAFARIVRNGAGQPAELHLMNPHELSRIEFGNNTNEVFKKFVFTPMNNRFATIELSYDDLLYFYYPHPGNVYLPCTPIQGLAHVTDLDLYMQIYEKAFFLNNARPDLVISTKGDLTKAQAERIAEAWNEKHRGPGRSHRPAILSNGTTVQPLSMSARDFEFLALSEWTKDQVLAAYLIPEAMLGQFESFNKASSITAETVFVKSCIDPRLAMFEDVINCQLITQFRGTQGLEFRHMSALPKDDEWDLAKNTGELSVGLTHVNEVRKLAGKKAYDCKLLDVPWINGAPVPGVNEEADKLWKENNLGGAAAPAGGAVPGMDALGGGAVPGMDALGGGAVPGMEVGGAVPGAGQLPPAPAAQGPMGQMGGRPQGQELSTLLYEAMRATKPSLSTLLNAARGKRGGLSALIQSHPEMGSFGAALAKDRYDSTMSKLLSKTIYDYIEETLPDEDKFVFKGYEGMIEACEALEDEYVTEVETFFVEKGAEFADIVEKALSNFVTKESFDDIDEMELKEAYRASAEDAITEATRLGFNFGVQLVSKAAGYEPDVAQEAAYDAAGKFLDRSADLKVESTKKALVKIIQQGLEKGLDSERVAKMIRDQFEDMGAARSEMIARTELAGAVDAGLDASFEAINRDAGEIVVEKAVFWTSLDERVCKRGTVSKKGCLGLHEEVVKNYRTGEEFIEIPAHPRCRCVRRPILAT